MSNRGNTFSMTRDGQDRHLSMILKIKIVAMSAYCFVPVLYVPRQMQITSSSLDSISFGSHKIASEYHITWPRRCLRYAAFKTESDLDLQDQNHPKNVIFKIKIRSLT